MTNEEVKQIIISAFNRYKDYWHRGGVKDWDYEIRARYYGDEYVIEIRCGRNFPACAIVPVYRNSVRSYEDQTQEDHELSVNNLWKRVLIDICTAGIVADYKNTITLHREDRFPFYAYNGASEVYAKNPLTVEECFPAKEHRTEVGKDKYPFSIDTTSERPYSNPA